MDGTHSFESVGGEFVFLVEVGGDDEVAVLVKFFEGLLEDLGPDGFVVPVVLVAEEGDVGRADFGEVEEAVATVGDEVDAGIVLAVFGEFLFPTRVGLVDFGRADVETLEVGGL